MGDHKKEVDDGLHVFQDHRAPHNYVSNIEHLVKEVSQAGTSVDNLAVYESVKLAVIVPLIGMTKGTHGNFLDVFGVTQHPIEVTNYEQFVSGFKSTG